MKISLNAQRKLEDIVDAVAESYNHGRPIDSLESTALPNRRKIVRALRDLEYVCFIGYYASEGLNRVNLRHYIAERLYQAHGELVEQIARALVYQRRAGGSPEEQDVTQAEKVVGEVLEGIPALREKLSLDLQAAFDGDPAAKNVEEIVFSYPGIQAIAIYRVAHEFYLRDIPMIPRIMTDFAHSITGIELHPGARIGKRFFIDHGTGVVVGETAIIGDDVKLYQGVTLGALSMPRDDTGTLIRNVKRHPTIEDGVTIYASATILGGDTVIGRDSIIGANTWIVESVPPETRVSYSAYGGPDGRSQSPGQKTDRKSARPAAPKQP